jgi:MOSC domain-containing protein YiiM
MKPGSHSGRVHSVNVSGGGVPKTPVPSAHVRTTGVEGDRQRDLRYHGGPDRAVSLFSSDLIESLRADGHPIAPGSIGENLTLAGLDWNQLAPGVRVQIGDVVLEVTSAVPPCRKIAGSFRDGDFSRVSEKRSPARSRFYCRVLAEGSVRVGDSVQVLVPEG